MNAYPDNQAQQRPNVAVILPIYNQEKYVARALDSLLAQTYGNWIAYCVNDGSTDSTAEILRNYASEDARFVVIPQANGGLPAARNTGLEVAITNDSVRYICFLDPDDFTHPQQLEIATHFAEQNPRTVIEWGFATTQPEAFQSRRYSPADIISRESELSHCVWNKIYPKELLRSIRFFVPAKLAEDAAFTLELDHREHPRRVVIQAILSYYTEIPTSETHRPLPLGHFRGMVSVIEHIIGLYRDDPAALDRFARIKLPDLLKQFYRYLIRRSKPSEAAASWAVFREELRSLRKRGLLHPRKGRLKDIKYYLRFLIMSLREQGPQACV